MPDISKCTGKGCKIREKCWRFTSEANPLWQCYADFDVKPVKFQKDCDAFWKVEKK